MRKITRRFVMSPNMVFLVSNGVIFSQTITDFISGNSKWLDELLRSGDNVGWSTTDTLLMITDDDKIYRVSLEMYVRMVKDESTSVIPVCNERYDMVTYDCIKYSDEFLQVNKDYKNGDTVRVGQCVVTKLNLRNDTIHSRNRIIAMESDTVYIIQGKRLSIVPMSYYVGVYGNDWRNRLKRSDDNIGFILDDKMALMIAEGYMDALTRQKALQLISDETTESKSFIGNACVNVVYNTDKFLDSYLGLTTAYKFIDII